MKRRRFIFFAVTQIYYIGWLLLDFADVSSPHLSALLLSIMPFFPIWGSFLMFQLTFQEIRCDPFYKDRGQYIGNPL